MKKSVLLLLFVLIMSSSCMIPVQAEPTYYEAYQGIFMRDADTFIEIPLYTDVEPGGSIGIAYLVDCPIEETNGYISAEVISSIGELYGEAGNYSIIGENMNAPIYYGDGTLKIVGNSVYAGDYIQVSNYGADLNPADIWLNVPENSNAIVRAEGHYLKNFNLKQDVFNFTNSEGDIGVLAGKEYSISESTLDNFFSYFYFSTEDRDDMKERLESFNGVCGGMVSVLIKNYYGDIDLSVYKAETLSDLEKPATNKKLKYLIGLNDIVHETSKYVKTQMEFMLKYKDDEPIKYLYELATNIDKTNAPIYVDIAWVTEPFNFSYYEETGAVAHALMVYGIEDVGAPYIIDGEEYAYRLLIVDPNVNYVTQDLKEDNYIYISENLDECIIPDTGTRSTVTGDYHHYNHGRMFNYNDFVFQLITDDIDLIDPKGSVDYSEEQLLEDAKIIHEYITSSEADYTDDILCGEWELDYQKMNEENDNPATIVIGHGGVKSGNSMKFNSDGNMSYYFGIGCAGEGLYTYQNNIVEYLGINIDGETESYVISVEYDNGKVYLVQAVGSDNLYWIKKENNSFEYIQEKLIEYYSEGIPEDGWNDLTVLEGEYIEGTGYVTTVRGGVPGNQQESQSVYKVTVDITTGDVTQIYVFGDNEVKYFNLFAMVNEQEKESVQEETVSSEYILPNSATEYITREQLANLDINYLCLARNEIFARHGRSFITPEISAYFESKSWYTAQYSGEEFDAMMYQILSEVEFANIELIKTVEAERGNPSGTLQGPIVPLEDLLSTENLISQTYFSFNDLGVDFLTEYEGYYSTGKNGYQFIKVISVEGDKMTYYFARPEYDDEIGHAYYTSYGEKYTADLTTSTKFYTGSYEGAAGNVFGSAVKEASFLISGSKISLAKECSDYGVFCYAKIVNDEVDTILSTIVFAV